MQLGCLGKAHKGLVAYHGLESYNYIQGHNAYFGKGRNCWYRSSLNLGARLCSQEQNVTRMEQAIYRLMVTVSNRWLHLNLTPLLCNGGQRNLPSIPVIQKGVGVQHSKLLALH